MYVKFAMTDFGMTERKQNGMCYIQVVRNRKAETLLSIIYDHCNEGSLIHSDSWSSYNKITEFLNLQHETVNHTVNFIDPETGASGSKCCFELNRASKSIDILICMRRMRF